MKSWMSNRLVRLGIAGALFATAYLMPTPQAAACVDDPICWDNCYISCAIYIEVPAPAHDNCMQACGISCNGCPNGY
ncbi:MAG TPA: hypothetical protein DD490_15915 [Acidobacteria bacterium]|nr:hypothetical protein [Acidobacteriota bacterium]